MSNTNNTPIRDMARQELKHLAPKNHINGILYKKEDAKKLPREFLCEKHGTFSAKFSEVSTEKVMVNGVCNECIKEFDLILDKKEEELSKIEEEKLKQKKMDARTEKLKRLGVSKRYINNSFDNYIAETPEKQNALLKCKELCDRVINNESPYNLIMVGGVGTGKTHLANSMVVVSVDNNKSAERVNMIDMIRALKSTWSKDSEVTEESLLSYFTRIGILIIDEVGIQFNSDTEKMFIFDIINGRYENCLPTVIISNLDLDGVKGVIGERCVDRLREDGGKVIAFNWNSHR